MKHTQLLILPFLLFSVIQGVSQSASIELIKSGDAPYRGICYDIEVTLQSGEGRLSSQNYRLYYDASALKFDRRSALSALTTTTYNPLRVVQAMHNSNASGYGNLDFSGNIGYINMTITDDVSHPSVEDTPIGLPIKTASFCFERVAGSDGGDIVWARDPLTKGYASAFTELSLMDKTGTTEVVINEYIDVNQTGTNPNDRVVGTNID